MLTLVIHLHPQSPPKPPVGEACNGCGVCCALEPCPVGMLLSWRRRGRCRRLVWSVPDQRYHCGVLLGTGRIPGWWGRVAGAVLSRWIAAGQGCDSTVEVPIDPAG